MKRISVVFAGLLFSSLGAIPAGATVLFSQSPANTSAWTSETSNGSNGFNQVWDNFTLGSQVTVTNVAWTGWILPDFGIINGFTIGFYADAVDGPDHFPGALIYSAAISGFANETRVGAHNAYGIFDFNAPVVFTANANTQYWISIVADPQSATFGWANSNGGDSSFFEDDQNGTVGPVATDVAFTLSNASTPEPSSFALAGTGMLALGGMVRRRVAGK
jgi:hypothetical protein